VEKTRQALEAIKKCMAAMYLGPELKKGLIEAETSVLKGLPIKPKELDTDHGYFVCQVCGFTVGYCEEYKDHRYCMNCGQRIDWSDGDDN